VLPIQMRYGWRMSFYVFGAAGLVWAAVWYAWFRDSPEEKRGQVAPLSTTAGASPAGHSFPWHLACRSKTVWSILGLAFCYVYVYNFFQTWFHTFLIRGRGFSEANLLLSALPYVVAACANLAGGAASDALVRRVGAKRGRRVIGATALTVAAAFTGAAMLTHHQVLTVVFLALTYGAITFQQSGVFGVCLDIGGPRAGAMVGLMNTLAQVGGLAGSVLYGYIVARTGSYDAPFIPMAVLLLVGAALWVNVDASREIGGDSPATLTDVAEGEARRDRIGVISPSQAAFRYSPVCDLLLPVRSDWKYRSIRCRTSSSVRPRSYAGESIGCAVRTWIMTISRMACCEPRSL
jgi:MFS transporter, ACS family, glucarate transporter